MIRRFFIFFIFILLSRLVYSQESDFGAWYEVNAEKSFSKKFDISGAFMVRTFDNASKIDQLFFELGASYSLNKYLGFAASYRIGNYVEDDYLYHVRNKWFTDIKGTLPAGNFVFSARVRFQILARTYIEDPGDDKVEYDGRIRLKGVYKIPDFPVNPYLSFETFTPLFRNEGRFVDKSRTSVGLEFKLSKKHAIDAEYIYQRDNVPHLSIMHIISLGYTFKF
ncbi:MAG: DUF2490 domain-containing protein [Bacteroidales bacterium]|nr:DUF2490 domain-containing protein [Bacteroidales bacterium]